MDRRTVNAADKAVKLAERHGVGVRLNATGDGLALEAEAAPPSDLIEVLREAKAEIVAALRRQAVVQWVNERFVSSSAGRLRRRMRQTGSAARAAHPGLCRRG